MANNQGSSAGEFLGGVGRDIFSSLCLSAAWGLCVAIGLAESPDLGDWRNWRLWVLALGCIGLLVFGGNTVRLVVLRYFKMAAMPGATGQKLAVLIATISGDEDGSRRETIRDTVNREMGEAVDILVWPGHLALGEGRDADARASAHRTAQQWLRSKHCDLLIWGRANADRSLTLNFTTRDDAGAGKFYVFGDAMDLPPNFGDDLALALVGRIASELSTVNEHASMVPLMRRIVGRLTPIIDRSKNGATRAALELCNASLLSEIGVQTGDQELLRTARDHIENAIETLDGDDYPQAWAFCQCYRGKILMHLDDKTPTEELLIDATLSFEAAIGVLSRDGEMSGASWAKCNLATAHLTRARSEGAAALHRAISLYRECESEVDDRSQPILATAIRSNLSIALVDLTNFGINELEEAVSVARRALAGISRKSAPLLWATSQGNLARALGTLGRRQGDPAYICEALEHCYRALAERHRATVPMSWASTVSIWAELMVELGEITKDNGPIHQAIAAYRLVLLERTLERTPNDWASTKDSLGLAIYYAWRRDHALSSHRPTKSLFEAKAHIEDALQIALTLDTPLESSSIQNNLANVLLALAVAENSPARLSAARSGYEEALQILGDRSAGRTATIQANLERALRPLESPTLH